MLENRIFRLNNKSVNEGPIIYWMSREQRAEDNHALFFAQSLALQMNRALLVVFCLAPNYSNSSIRKYSFILYFLKKTKNLRVKRVFWLTFETKFFAKHGFQEIEGTPVEPEIYTQLLESYDVGVAEFLDLDKVKPNTLGNTRMIKHLQ